MNTKNRVLAGTALSVPGPLVVAPEHPATMEEAWARFASLALPEGAPGAQLSAMQRSYYAGATALVAALGQRLRELGPDDDPNIPMQVLTQELDAFSRRVWRGEA